MNTSRPSDVLAFQQVLLEENKGKLDALDRAMRPAFKDKDEKHVSQLAYVVLFQAATQIIMSINSETDSFENIGMRFANLLRELPGKIELCIQLNPSTISLSPGLLETLRSNAKKYDFVETESGRSGRTFTINGQKFYASLSKDKRSLIPDLIEAFRILACQRLLILQLSHINRRAVVDLRKSFSQLLKNYEDKIEDIENVLASEYSFTAHWGYEGGPFDRLHERATNKENISSDSAVREKLQLQRHQIFSAYDAPGQAVNVNLARLQREIQEFEAEIRQFHQDHQRILALIDEAEDADQISRLIKQMRQRRAELESRASKFGWRERIKAIKKDYAAAARLEGVIPPNTLQDHDWDTLTIFSDIQAHTLALERFHKHIVVGGQDGQVGRIIDAGWLPDADEMFHSYLDRAKRFLGLASQACEEQVEAHLPVTQLVGRIFHEHFYRMYQQLQEANTFGATLAGSCAGQSTMGNSLWNAASQSAQKQLAPSQTERDFFQESTRQLMVGAAVKSIRSTNFTLEFEHNTEFHRKKMGDIQRRIDEARAALTAWRKECLGILMQIADENRDRDMADARRAAEDKLAWLGREIKSLDRGIHQADPKAAVKQLPQPDELESALQSKQAAIEEKRFQRDEKESWAREHRQHQHQDIPPVAKVVAISSTSGEGNRRDDELPRRDPPLLRVRQRAVVPKKKSLGSRMWAFCKRNKGKIIGGILGFLLGAGGGAVAGFFVGGPIGAIIGGAVGAAAGTAAGIGLGALVDSCCCRPSVKDDVESHAPLLEDTDDQDHNHDHKHGHRQEKMCGTTADLQRQFSSDSTYTGPTCSAATTSEVRPGNVVSLPLPRNNLRDSIYSTVTVASVPSVRRQLETAFVEELAKLLPDQSNIERFVANWSREDSNVNSLVRVHAANDASRVNEAVRNALRRESFQNLDLVALEGSRLKPIVEAVLQVECVLHRQNCGY